MSEWVSEWEKLSESQRDSQWKSVTESARASESQGELVS